MGLTNLEITHFLIKRLDELLGDQEIDAFFIANVMGVTLANLAERLADRRDYVQQQFIASAAHAAVENLKAFRRGEFTELKAGEQ